MSKKIDPTHSAAQSNIVFLQEMPNGGGSDLTLKEDIVDLPNVLEQVLALRPVTWSWKDKSLGNTRKYGFIAQEVEKIMPDLVYKDTWIDGTERKFISTKELLPYLTAAIKEQQRQIDELKTRITSLETNR